ncbi:dipeptidase PepV [Marvinbryantia formatexigens DSM 14469]|uniref:Dipeptidase PepV n=1 Tax=Marvinbryantia formatexigens DSM 14469 TaxID=478749 RepID=C6L8Z2_9FIRM|nr:dipeptidase PepV [Marvinbryantia formatexigens DSM 14469]SDF99301.1 succinyl-diaminopimelate desuccinylase [Marvinbryantia formatexigens]
MQIPGVASAQETGAAGAPFGAGCRLALEKMQEIARREHIRQEDADGYCLILEAGEGDTVIGIFSHLDVVPAGEGWTYPPFAGVRKNGYLIGRGVQDNKGPAIAAFYALCYCREKGLLDAIRVRQVLGCQEECGMKDVAYYLENYGAPAYSFVADCAFPVCCGEKGTLRIELEAVQKTEEILSLSAGTVCNSVPAFAEAEILTDGKREHLQAKGIGGHAAFPEGTENALKPLMEKISRRNLSGRTAALIHFLEMLAADGYGEAVQIACEDDISGRLTCNPGIVGIREGRLYLKIDIRYPVTVKTEEFLPVLLRKAEKAGFRTVSIEDDAPYYMEKTHPFVQVLMHAWEEETGKKGEPFVMGGGTYARKIPNAVAFGPGMEQDFSTLELPEGHGGCHSADEAQSIENLKTAVVVYVKALIKINQWIKEKKKDENV